jgi:signal peptidase I
MPTPAVTPSPQVFAALAELAREEAVPVAVAGDCMAPVIEEGSVAAVRAARLYWPGDVLAFAGADGRLVLHRLLGYRLHRGRPAFVTRGDGNPVHDFPVAPARVLGRAAVAVPLGARLAALAGWLGIAWRRLGRSAG